MGVNQPPQNSMRDRGRDRNTPAQRTREMSVDQTLAWYNFTAYNMTTENGTVLVNGSVLDSGNTTYPDEPAEEVDEGPTPTLSPRQWRIRER